MILTGAFGSAVLYRRKEDDAMVIIKEINMLELSASERQMALNECNVLAMLDHPNIVRCGPVKLFFPFIFFSLIIAFIDSDY